MKTKVRMVGDRAVRTQEVEQSSLRKFVDYLGLTVIFGLGALALLSLSTIPGFQLALFSILGTRVAVEGIPANSSRNWESFARNAVTGAFFLTLAAAVIMYGIAIGAIGSAAAAAATALPYLFIGMVGVGLLHTGIGLIGQIQEYFSTQPAYRTDLMRHKLQTTAISFIFQAALTAAIVCSVVIPGAQIALAAMLPFAIIGMIGYKLWERERTKQLEADEAIIAKKRASEDVRVSSSYLNTLNVTPGQTQTLQTVAPAAAVGEVVEERRPLLEEVRTEEKHIEAPVDAASTVTVGTGSQGFFKKDSPLDITMASNKSLLTDQERNQRIQPLVARGRGQ